MSAVAKPQLRGLLSSRLKRDFIFAFGFTAVCSLGWYFGIMRPRKTRYAEYYKTYDAQVDFERMKTAGVFMSVRPDGKVGDW